MVKRLPQGNSGNAPVNLKNGGCPLFILIALGVMSDVGLLVVKAVTRGA